MTEIADLTAELHGDPIEGFARAAIERWGSWDAARFAVPLISHIEGNLYVGGYQDDVRLPDSFVRTISLYPGHEYLTGPDTARTSIEMLDEAKVDGATVEMAALLLATSLDSGPTLVHCQAGLNRSNLVAARALMLFDGRSADDAIELLRERRSPVVLCNATFENYLRNASRGKRSDA